MSSIKCLICKKETEEFAMLGPNQSVCNDCIKKIQNISVDNRERFWDSVSAENKAEKGSLTKHYEPVTSINYDEMKKFRPSIIKQKLDDYIVGQESAKKILSVAAYNHMKRTELNDKDIQKSNVLLIGPTGSGKTLLAKTLGRILNLPVAIVPATNLTEAGYVGDDVSTVVERLLQAADGNVERAERGIIFIDEIDKLVSNGNGAIREVGGKGVQQALLPILEGTIVNVAAPNGSNTGIGVTAKLEIDTSNILFICGGAFPDVEAIIKKRISGGTSIGFTHSQKESTTVDEKNLLLQVKTDDLKTFGLIPEFLGRLPVVAPLEELSIDALKEILTNPKDSIISQYKKLFSVDGVCLTFEDEALTYIATKAVEKGIGARSLRGMLEEILLELMYAIPDDMNLGEVIITYDYVRGEGEPDYISRVKLEQSYSML